MSKERDPSLRDLYGFHSKLQWNQTHYDLVTLFFYSFAGNKSIAAANGSSAVQPKTGVLSTQIIPLSYVYILAFLSNAYILAFLQLRAKSSHPAALYLNLALSDPLVLLSLVQRGPSSGFSSSSPCLSRPGASCTSPNMSACFPTGATGCTGTTG